MLCAARTRITLTLIRATNYYELRTVHAASVVYFDKYNWLAMASGGDL